MGVLSFAKKIFYLALIGSLSSCTWVKKEEIKTEPGITLRNIIQADNRGDLEKVISLYTDDAILMPAGSENVVGREAIRKNYEAIFSSTLLRLHPRINEEIISDSLSVIRGTITGKTISKADSTENIVDDKFLMILKKKDNEWKIHRLMWSNQNHD